MTESQLVATSQLIAISPIDGRYRKRVENLSNFFSEYALIRYRVYIEIEYFCFLAEIIPLEDFDLKSRENFRKIYTNFTTDEAIKIKKIESVTNHDVKAVEYYLRRKYKHHQIGSDQYIEYIHFGLTSQDINTSSVSLSIKDGIRVEVFPLLSQIHQLLLEKSELWLDIPMLSRTHGQAASPTLLGKELMVFVERLVKQMENLANIKCYTKLGGAVGNLNAHYATFPNIEWNLFLDKFCQKIGLVRNKFTTQIDHYDDMVQIFDTIKRINTILIDLDRDIWSYISMGYFNQTINQNEVGSSTMPHKINPIDFENSEGNLMLANNLFEFLARKLPISRLQRDLTDSTVLRNLGTVFGHCLVGYKSLIKGLLKLQVNIVKINQDLDNHWEVLAEPIQIIMKREGFPRAYEKLKELTRNNRKITRNDIYEFIESLDTNQINDTVKNELHKLTPFNYVGKCNFK